MPTANCQLPNANCQCRLPIAECQLPIAAPLIQPDEENAALFNMGCAGDVLGLALVLAGQTYAHPFAGGAGELNHVGVLVAVLQPLFQLARLMLAMEGAD